MVDFHSHIIPEIDDGSRSIEETMLLLEEAKKAGFSKIICTSHYLEKYYEFDEASRKQFLESTRSYLLERYPYDFYYLDKQAIKESTKVLQKHK